MSTAFSSAALLDDGTLQAIQVLAAAVERERIPGIVEFHQTADALSRAYASRSPEDLEYAVTAFDSLDRELRTRIVERAHAIARTERGRLPIPAPPASVPARAARPARRTSGGATGFLSALNHGTRGAKPEVDGRSAVRDRLLADLGRKTGGDDISVEEIIPPRYDGPPPKWW
ncbi:MAG TPA: hypothetical protein VD995_06750 [Azospirillum sp.]|nr:hypothetical protein [Azospirillum sp.]